MTNVLHIQYPVGQGGLHLGIIGDSAYIYDCGSVCGYRCTRCLSDIKYKLIDYNINKLYIFISHLHQDHVCALKELLPLLPKGIRCTLYLPYITALEKLYLLASSTNMDVYDMWYTDLIINPQSIKKILPECQIFYVSNTETENKQDNEVDKTQIKTCEAIKASILQPGIIFDPFVYEIFKPNTHKDFITKVQELAQTSNWPLTEQELLRVVKNNLPQLCKAYSLLSQNINYTCLCLYCGFAGYVSITDSIFRANSCCNDLVCNTKPSWLHTGDYNVKCGRNSKYGKKFVEHYQRYFDYVGVVQIPHHGSSNNISKTFINKLRNNNCVWFFTGELYPYGKQQPKRSSILQQIVQPVILVSELPCSGIIQQAYLKE